MLIVVARVKGVEGYPVGFVDLWGIPNTTASD